MKLTDSPRIPLAGYTPGDRCVHFCDGEPSVFGVVKDTTGPGLVVVVDGEERRWGTEYVRPCPTRYAIEGATLEALGLAPWQSSWDSPGQLEGTSEEPKLIWPLHPVDGYRLLRVLAGKLRGEGLGEDEQVLLEQRTAYWCVIMTTPRVGQKPSVGREVIPGTENARSWLEAVGLGCVAMAQDLEPWHWVTEGRSGRAERVRVQHTLYVSVDGCDWVAAPLAGGVALGGVTDE